MRIPSPRQRRVDSGPQRWHAMRPGCSKNQRAFHRYARFFTVIACTKRGQPFRAGRVEHVKAALPSSAPPMMLAQCLQRPRKTRPPVPRSELQHYPYVAAPVLPSLAASACVPCVEIETVRDSPRKTRRRRRGKSEQNRPQARFWWPPEGCGGKSLGYAMGY